MEKLPEYIVEIFEDITNNCSYGVAILNNGTTINIRRNFQNLVGMWSVYNYYKEIDLDEYRKFMDKCKGIYYNGETAIRLNDISALVNGEETIANNKKGASQRDYPSIIDCALNTFTTDDDNNTDCDEEN